ncbi:MAG: SpoIID/LytB domain-containing protein [Gemmatimonadetes bacterium]|nr:SpoIID/LytB domain-containing protein [Gemmatimonadota bacterium]
MLEPTISVGLIQAVPYIVIRTAGEFIGAGGAIIADGDYHITRDGDRVAVTGMIASSGPDWSASPRLAERGRFSLETTIGIDFHWEQRECQSFSGGLRVIPSGDHLLTVINDVPLETYLASVICSEMSSTSAPDLARAHAVIARSWLLAQMERRGHVPAATPPGRPLVGGEWIRWYDRESHTDFDVCADDHCQRYQGTDRIDNPRVLEAIRQTRGQVLTFQGTICDARYSKCCGGVSEDFRAAWGDEQVPYLVPVRDYPSESLPSPPLSEEAAARAWIESTPRAWCHCTDNALLDTFLPSYDRLTHDFYRWTVRLEAEMAGHLVRDKLGVDLGRITALEPLERGRSGRIVRLRIVGEQGAITIGKELEIRRALSPKHLYSSAFVVDRDGDAFILKGAGWGHGVGLCQIGAAVMAAKIYSYADILAHYYPGATLETLY